MLRQQSHKTPVQYSHLPISRWRDKREERSGKKKAKDRKKEARRRKEETNLLCKVAFKSVKSQG